MRRLFLVGCPRSGTTLLQSLIASHPEVVSFPETHFFSKTISINRFVQTFTVYGNSHRDQIRKQLEDLNAPLSLADKISVPKFSTVSWVKELLPVLDDFAEHFAGDSRPTFFLEKTPRHLHFIDEISESDPEAQFIHIVRRGEEVVASLTEATRNNPGHWEGERSLDKSIFWWNRSIRIFVKYLGKPNNHFVFYDDLVAHTKQVIKALFEQIGLEYDPSIISDYHKTADSLISEGEAWKAKNTQKEISHSGKFDALTSGEQDYVRQKLIPFDFNRIRIPV